jgi:opacity protein-like surface antigen
MRSAQIKATLAFILFVTSLTVHAQDGAKAASEVAAEVVESGNSTVTSNNTNVNTTTSEAKAENGPVQARSEVVIITPVQTIEQPTTVVSASPLITSEADELRKQRERAEIETEQKIVEKLERSRLSDEQSRMNRLFKPVDETPAEKKEVTAAAVAPATSTTTIIVEPKQEAGGDAVQNVKIETGTAAESNAAPVAVAQEVVAPVVEAPAVVVAPVAPVFAPVVVAPVAETAVKADVSDIKEVVQEEKKNRFSVGGSLLSLDYPDSFNTQSDFGAGVSFGWEGPNRIGIEASLVYSSHTIDESYSFYKQVDQYNWMVTARYSVLPTKITPVVGAIASYTRREYTDMYAAGFSNFTGGQSASSDAIDAGVLVGVDFSASKNITLGLEYRFMTNLNSRYDNPEAFNRSIYQSNNKFYQTLEDIDYDLLGFSMKFLF